jgi:putative flippase GtrA
MTESSPSLTWFDAPARGAAHWAVLTRFLLIGGVSALAMVLLALVFVSGLHLPPPVAQGLAHALGIVPTYVCQRTLTFRSDISHARGLAGYVLLQAPLLALGAGLAGLLISYLHWPRLEALLLIAGAVALTSFVAQRSLIFARTR